MKSQNARIIIYFIISFLLLVPVSEADAQVPYRIEELSGAKGPTDLLVKTIYRDGNNLIWLGTGNSVERFDGNDYVRYSFAKAPLYKEDNAVSSIVCTGNYAYWAGNKFGVWKLNHRTFMIERVFPDAIQFPVKQLATDAEGNLYIGTTNGLYIAGKNIIAGDDITQTGTGNALKHLWMNKGGDGKDNRLVDLSVENAEKVWWLVSDGVVFCNPETGSLSKYNCPEVAEYGAFTCCQRVGERLYLGTERAGVIAFDLKKYTFTPFWNAWKSAVSCLSYDASTGMLGIGTLNDGLLLYDLKKHKPVYEARYVAGGTNSLLSNSVSSLLVFGHDVWAGTNFYLGWNHLSWQYPLFRLYENGGFSTRNVPVRSFMHTDGRMFTGTRDGFYVSDERSGKTVFYTMGQPATKALRSNLIFSFYKYMGLYYVGTCHGGLYTFEPQTGRLLSPPEFQPLRNSDIFMCLTDEQGVMWMATLDGLFRYDGRTRQLKGYTPSNSNIPGDIVYGIRLDKSGRFWAATNKGVALFDRKTGRFSMPASVRKLVGDRISEVVYEDRWSGDLFFITLKGELFSMDKALRNGRRLLDDMDVVVENIMQDNSGNYWIGTNHGLLKADRRFSHIVCYSNTDDIPALSANPGTPMAIDSNGELWFANTRGLVGIDTKVAYTPPKMRITDIVVNGQVKAGLNSGGLNGLRLGRRENNLTFRFSRMDCGSLESVWMEYKLEGYDTGWRTLQGKGEVSYFNLPSGTYVFKVRRLLDAASMATVEVRITDTAVWVWSVPGIILIVALIFGYRYRHGLLSSLLAFLKRQEKQKDKAERTEYAAASEAEFKAIADKVRLYMVTEKPYLNVDFKQADLAGATGYSIFSLSRMFNLYLKTGYYDFVNAYRVEEFKRLVDEGAYRTYTLKSLAGKCGFKSQASFFRTFKKCTGMTPNNYINAHRNDG